MKLTVLSEEQIKYYQSDVPHVIISIKSPGASPAYFNYNKKKCMSIVWLTFYDLDSPVESMNVKESQLFAENDALAILFAVDLFKPEEVICQCEAGISRSAGVAGALSLIYNGTDNYFFKHYLPNMRVYKKILEVYHNGENRIR